MLYWALGCLVVAIITGILGFGGIAGGAEGAAQVLFFISITLMTIAIVINAVKGPGPKI